jgi:hypothetical protein
LQLSVTVIAATAPKTILVTGIAGMWQLSLGVTVSANFPVVFGVSLMIEYTFAL